MHRTDPSEMPLVLLSLSFVITACRVFPVMHTVWFILVFLNGSHPPDSNKDSVRPRLAQSEWRILLEGGVALAVV